MHDEKKQQQSFVETGFNSAIILIILVFLFIFAPVNDEKSPVSLDL